jgi:endonuclease YncB( thermonuclease family)
VRVAAAAALVWLLASGASASCIDINADARERLQEIVHIDEQRALAIEAGRPWPAVASLTALHGIGGGRIRNILAEGLACVGVRAKAGERAVVDGVATVLDADTLIVADVRIRLIGIDAPERRQNCRLDDADWLCGTAAIAAVDALVGTEPIACEIYGHDRFDRALAVCYQNGTDLNAEIVRNGWALAWYPKSGAVIGPDYAAAQWEAEQKAAGIWQSAFTDPWIWRRTN